MSLTWEQATEMVKDAELTIRQMEVRVSWMARIIAGKLEAGNVDAHTLCVLKRELSNFNMRTCEWMR
jgi:hypothetical protein